MLLFTLGAAGLTAALAVLSAAWPLLTYTVSLASFGGAHVWSELRYVGARFGPRVQTRFAVRLVALVTGVVLLRVARMVGLVPTGWGGPMELGLVILLAASALNELRGWGWSVGLGILTTLGVGLLVSPVHALLTLAVLHNFTPLGFIAEAWPKPRRHLAVGGAALAFMGAPLLIASGLLFKLFDGLGWAQPELSLLPVGPLAEHFGAYLPPSMHDSPWALHAFSAVVCAQTLHYAAVLLVLPRLHPIPTPPGLRVGAAVGLALLALAFTLDFGPARSLYGVPAAVHAWIEIPLLLVFLLPSRSPDERHGRMVTTRPPESDPGKP